ncbi:hypothetical protein DM01DRAFT_1338724 [Hesseltinella vesiculosa]|uniref:Uncharacterized protein n=1 Tax=Hesseltinella vesiculosa TaxID=101127 RepID=A0A1X2G991_9FUNG|nr:hypothetical protein DM01DRAFT_1338724 [Hesseltinella vesiculosa]
MEAKSSVITPKESKILASQLEIEWLETQILQRKLALQTPPNNDDVTMLTDEDILQQQQAYSSHLEDLRSKADAMTQFNVTKDMIAKGLERSSYALRALYPVQDTSTGDALSMKLRQAEDMILERDKLVVQINQLLEELRNVDTESENLSYETSELRKQNRDLVCEFEQLQDSMDPLKLTTDYGSVTSSQPVERTKDKLLDMKNRLEISRNILLVKCFVGSPCIVLTDAVEIAFWISLFRD